MDNAGLTLTIAPLEGSPVVNAQHTGLVEEYELGTYQRGRERILAGAPDMRSVEFCESDSDCTYEKKSGGLLLWYSLFRFGLAT